MNIKQNPNNGFPTKFDMNAILALFKYHFNKYTL
jgi:hypothetical protein